MNEIISQASNCPCDTFVHPLVLFNHPGLTSLDYRVGDYLSFRHALLLSRPGETELTNWKPTAQGDLALQMMEWWAYLADILTFYNERIANQSYLGTADQPENITRLIRLLGYRPRPGIGATGWLAALINRPTPFTLPQGFAIQSKPGPGKQPQIFELFTDTSISPPDTAALDSATHAPLSASTPSVLLAGPGTTAKIGDELLLLENGWNGQNSHYATVKVTAIQQEKDPQGKTNTRITFDQNVLSAGIHVQDYRLLKSLQSAYMWQLASQKLVFQKSSDSLSAELHLSALTRQVKVGDPVLFIGARGLAGAQLASVVAYSEATWYANPDSPDTPYTPPAATNVPAIPIPHSVLEVAAATKLNAWDIHGTTLRYAWQDVGQLIDEPTTQFATDSLPSFSAVVPASLPEGIGLPVLIEDATGQGVQAQASIVGGTMQLSGLPDVVDSLTAPLAAFFNLLFVTRGKTVPSEILGSGDATIAGQEFVLQKSPLTYLARGDSTSGTDYASTLQVRVNGLLWQEVPSFYAQPADAHIFVTREDETQKTHVQFGDGINGARLPSGINNITATYRYGSGADAPDAGQLTVIAQPWPNLKSIRNPVKVGVGADPDAPSQIKRYAPQSVLTFGRAISRDDYETIAAQAPGVVRARSYWSWSAQEQRSLVVIYVGDDQNAVLSARTALLRAEDPNRPVVVKLARAIALRLTFTLSIDPIYQSAAVIAAATTALLDSETGLFGSSVLRIGQVVYHSQICAVCLAIPGAIAIHGLRVLANAGSGFLEITGERYDPGEGGFFQLQTNDLMIS